MDGTLHPSCTSSQTVRAIADRVPTPADDPADLVMYLTRSVTFQTPGRWIIAPVDAAVTVRDALSLDPPEVTLVCSPALAPACDSKTAAVAIQDFATAFNSGDTARLEARSVPNISFSWAGVAGFATQDRNALLRYAAEQRNAGVKLYSFAGNVGGTTFLEAAIVVLWRHEAGPSTRARATPPAAAATT